VLGTLDIRSQNSSFSPNGCLKYPAQDSGRNKQHMVHSEGQSGLEKRLYWLL
jgi:hypothetical protein